jgi:hypothetical protein
MWAHPDAEELARYADQGPAASNGPDLEAHLRQCRECLAEVAEARNLRDLEAEGLLPTVPFRPGRRLAAYLKGSEGQQTHNTTAGTVGLLSGLFTAGLAAGRQITPAFSFGHTAGDESQQSNEHPAERNRQEDSSHLLNRHEPGTEGEDTPMTSITRPDPTIGTPEPDSHHFPGQQHYPDTCAIRCQEFIIRQFTGAHLPESYYVEEAKANHWYHEGAGTSMQNVGKLLEFHSIPVHRYAQANILNLTAELAQGHKVIIGVEADDLWRQHPMLTEIRHLFGFSAADHAVVVSGIDTSDPNHYKVIVSDPGTGEAAARYPMDQFITAWKESHFYMVATQDPPPENMHLPEMKNFDYQTGHIDHVGDMPYDSFHALLDEHQAGDAAADLHYFEDRLVHHLGPETSEARFHDDPATPGVPAEHGPSAGDHDLHPGIAADTDPSHRGHGLSGDSDAHHAHHDAGVESHNDWHHGIPGGPDSHDPDSGDGHDL